MQKELQVKESLNTTEPFKTFIRLVKKKLPFIESSSGGIELHDSKTAYKNSGELESDLQLLKRAISDYGAETIAIYDIQKVLRHIRVFGFHLAHLDIR